jgi:hypothetical protein
MVRNFGVARLRNVGDIFGDGFEQTISLGKCCRAPRKRNGETRTSPDWRDVRGIFPGKNFSSVQLEGTNVAPSTVPLPRIVDP